MFDTKDTLKDKKAMVDGQVSTQQKANQISDDDIHQMPEKFLPKKIGKRKVAAAGGNNQKKVLLVVVILVFFLAALISGAIIYLKKYANPELVAEEIIQVIPTPTPKATSTEEIVIPEEEATSTEEIVIPEEEATSTEEIVIPEEEEIDLDPDGDQLTLLEEELFGTDPDDDDSDKDGYKDGSELMSLYSPIASSQSLLDSGLVTVYKNVDNAYEIFMPTEWLAMPLRVNLSEIKFLTESVTGESISVQVNSNDTDWDIVEYAQGLNEQGLQNYSLGGAPALLSQDGMTVYTISDDFLYEIHYDVNNNEEPNFRSVFYMMLESFVMTEASDIIDEDPPSEDPPGDGPPLPPGEDGETIGE